MIGIGQMYKANHKITSYGIEGYAVEKKYQQKEKVMNSKNDKEAKEEQKKRQTKKGHYLQDYAKIHGDIPGPGDYDYPTENWTAPSKKNKSKVPHSKKLTFIAEIFQRGKKEKTPAPGQYKIGKDEKDIKAEKKRLAHRKISYTDRMTYLDNVQYEASVTPGVGAYNTTLPRPKSATMLKRHKQSISRPVSSLKRKEKMPGIGSYNPTFEGRKSFSKKKKGYSEWGKVERFGRSKSGNNLGPGSYLRGDEDKALVRTNIKSIYY